jgi:hypothetical protein
LNKKLKDDRKLFKEEFEDTKGVIRIRQSKKDRQHNDQKYKQQYTKHTLEYRSNTLSGSETI